MRENRRCLLGAGDSRLEASRGCSRGTRLSCGWAGGGRRRCGRRLFGARRGEGQPWERERRQERDLLLLLGQGGLHHGERFGEHGCHSAVAAGNVLMSLKKARPVCKDLDTFGRGERTGGSKSLFGFVFDCFEGGGFGDATGRFEGDKLLNPSFDLVHVPGYRLAQGADESALDLFSATLDRVEPVARQGVAGDARGEHDY